ncbi:complement component receptor 1-like protein [Protobothrops mucrosquamatus]|uniref:complement component receptor 1-like protein n=1 Tax=Protobothrops mucrosquamatus TaxID=103944 RepID=UPI000775EB76|nr:complement component receptor 1-like protein [Protobothrops mucrosquamatus]
MGQTCCGISKHLAYMSEQMNKQAKEISRQIADSVQRACNAYNMATNNTLDIDKTETCVSEIKIELADLLDCSKRNNVWIKEVAEKSRINNLTTYLISKINDLSSNMKLMDKDIEQAHWVYFPSNCTSPVPPPHSTLKEDPPQKSYPVGTNLTYHCITGYEYIPEINPSVTCLNTSKWSEISELCQGKKCPAPIIENGKVDAEDDIRLGGSVTFSCVPGFRLIGEATRKCILKDGKVDWNSALPHCEHIPCKRPDNILNGQYDPNPKDEYYIGSVVIYSCKRDFSLIGNSTITCVTAEDGLNGRWNFPAPECKQVKCDRPKVENGKITDLFKPSYTYNEAIGFECNSGYSAVGSLHIKCGANSSWVPASPKCVKVSEWDTTQAPCQEIQKFKSIKFLQTWSPQHTQTYTHTHTNTNGLWLYKSSHTFIINLLLLLLLEEPSYQFPDNCTSPILPPHSTLKEDIPKEGYPVGTNLTYHCNTGYEYIPGINPSITCLNTSKWTEISELCQGEKCPAPIIENGKVDAEDDARLGGSVTFSCVPGFRIIGEATRKCILKDGKVDWNSALPHCEQVKCDQPEVENGKITNLPKPSYTYNEAISIECNSGYSAVGSLHIKCGANSRWVPATPKCVKVTLPPTQSSTVNEI